MEPERHEEVLASSDATNATSRAVPAIWEASKVRAGQAAIPGRRSYLDQYGWLCLLPGPDGNLEPVLGRWKGTGVAVVVGAGRAVGEVEVDPHLPVFGRVKVEIAPRPIGLLTRCGVSEGEEQAVVVGVVGGEKGQLDLLSFNLETDLLCPLIDLLCPVGGLEPHFAAVCRLDLQLEVEGGLGRVVVESLEGGSQMFGDRRVGVVAKEVVFLPPELEELLSVHARQQPERYAPYSRQGIWVANASPACSSSSGLTVSTWSTNAAGSDNSGRSTPPHPTMSPPVRWRELVLHASSSIPRTDLRPWGGLPIVGAAGLPTRAGGPSETRSDDEQNGSRARGHRNQHLLEAATSGSVLDGAGGLADLDEVVVRITHVATNLSAAVDWRSEKGGPFGRPFLIDLGDVYNPDVQKGAD